MLRSEEPLWARGVNLLIPVIGTVLVAVIAGGSQVINSRNDRAQAHQEVDLLLKLDPTSDTAKQLNEVVQARVQRWHAKFYKHTPPLVGKRRGTRGISLGGWIFIAIGAIFVILTFGSFIVGFVSGLMGW